MSSGTKIEWTEATWNPVTGCTPISPGCQNCYAKRRANRLRARCGYPQDEPFRVTFHPDRLDEPLHWRKPRHIFVCSMSDLFHDSVTADQLDMVFSRIAHARHRHILQILTKRVERMAEFLRQHEPGPELDDTWGFFDGRLHPATGKKLETFGFRKDGWPLPNLWLGVTVENADYLWRIGRLLQIPAAVRFVSLEPLLGEIDLYHHMGGWEICRACGRIQEMPRVGHIKCDCIGWNGSRLSATGFSPLDYLDLVIVGPETGPGARPCKLEWIASIVKQCHDAGVPVFVKAVIDPMTKKPTHDLGRISNLLAMCRDTLRQMPGKGDDK
jgi:protein gp37